MRFKYYLRGIGIGILTATVILMIEVNSKGGILTDENAIKRAEELGYVLASGDASDESDSMTMKEMYATGDAAGAQDDETTAESGEDVRKEDNSEEDAEETAEVTKEDNSDEVTTHEETKTVSFTVGSSDGSETVSRHLYEAGLIDDAGDYNNYLINNGYERKLRTGTYEITSGLSYEEITAILLRRSHL